MMIFSQPDDNSGKYTSKATVPVPAAVLVAAVAATIAMACLPCYATSSAPFDTGLHCLAMSSERENICYKEVHFTYITAFCISCSTRRLVLKSDVSLSCFGIDVVIVMRRHVQGIGLLTLVL